MSSPTPEVAASTEKAIVINRKTLTTVLVTSAVVATGTAALVYKLTGGRLPEIVVPEAPAQILKS